MTIMEKHVQVRRVVETLAAAAMVDWATFYRQTLGVNGIVRQFFPTAEAMAEFERSETYQQVQQELARLRTHGPTPPEKAEPTRVITVRLPKSVHEALRAEAFEHRTSMNKLCISKLLQLIDREMVPSEA